MLKQKINIVWFKRDLRFTDHEPLYLAQQKNIPILLLYFFEPSLMAYPDSDSRHWRFVYESLQDMQSKLQALNTKIYIFNNEVLSVFQNLANHYTIKTIFSHQEIGNKISYDRDISMQLFCNNQSIVWKEFQLYGVIRKLKNLHNWQQRWFKTMQHSPKMVSETDWNFLKLDEILYLKFKGVNTIRIYNPIKNSQEHDEDAIFIKK